jgi:hypothetical protein
MGADLNAVVLTDEHDAYRLLHLAVLNDHADALQRMLKTGSVHVDGVTGIQASATTNSSTCSSVRKKD